MKSTHIRDIQTKIANETLSLDLSELNFESTGFKPDDSDKPPENMTVFEVGLNEFFACLMVHSISDSNPPKDSWNLLKQTAAVPAPLNPAGELYCISYNEKAADAVEKALRLTDRLTSIVTATKYAFSITEKSRTSLSQTRIQTIALNRAKNNFKSRDKIWREIDLGLDLLLSDRKNPENPEPTNGVGVQVLDISSPEDGPLMRVGYLVMHGHQLRQWVRQPQRFRLPDDVDYVTLAHYHILMALYRHGMWVIFTGHWNETPTDKYILSHIGAERISINPYSKNLQITIDRSLGLTD